MDKERRKKIILIAIIVLVIIGVLFLILSLSKRGEGPVLPPANEQPEFVPLSADLEYKPIKPKESSVEFTVLNLAKSFAARFGSWSTDNQGYNLQELLPLSSSRMRGYLSKLKQDEGAEGFIGITTKSLSAKVLSISDTEARVSVNTQRIRTDDSLSEDVYYQDIEIWLVKSDDGWLVDRATWVKDG